MAAVYTIFAFPIWKLVCFYIDGSEGVSAIFRSSFWSWAVGAGYAGALLVLAWLAVVKARSGDGRGLAGMCFLWGLGTIFLWMGSGFAMERVNFATAVSTVGISLLALCFSVKGWLRFRSRAFVLWVWASVISAIDEAMTRWLSEDGGSRYALDRFFDWGDPGRGQAPERHFIDRIVVNVLVVAGTLLLARQLQTKSDKPPTENTSKYVALAIFWLLIGLYPSVRIFGSAGFLTEALTSAALLGICVTVWRKLRLAPFAIWGCAAGIALLICLGIEGHRINTFPLGVEDQTVMQLVVAGNLMAGILWVVGLAVVAGGRFPLEAGWAGRGD
jgi:hypothetical protein